MKTILLLVVFALAGCANDPRTVSLPNGCVLDAAAYDLTLRAKAKLAGEDLWTRPIGVYGGEYGDGTLKSPGHCYLMYMYPPGANKLMAYDFRGSQRVRAYKDDPNGIAWHLTPFAARGVWLDQM